MLASRIGFGAPRVIVNLLPICEKIGNYSRVYHSGYMFQTRAILTSIVGKLENEALFIEKACSRPIADLDDIPAERRSILNRY